MLKNKTVNKDPYYCYQSDEESEAIQQKSPDEQGKIILFQDNANESTDSYRREF